MQEREALRGKVVEVEVIMLGEFPSMEVAHPHIVLAESLTHFVYPKGML